MFPFTMLTSNIMVLTFFIQKYYAKLLIIAAGNHKDSYISYNISKHMNLERNAYTYVCNYGKLLT